MKKHSGFTLIELMVVMAIIAILATAGLTAYSNYLKKARDSARVQTARALMIKVEQLANGGPLPTTAQLLTFLAEENFAYTLPEINPVIARIGGAIDTILGTALAQQLDLDPLGSPAGPCLGEADPVGTGLPPYSYCIFGYTRYSDGTYTIMHGIEHPDSKSNFWAAQQHGNQFYGEVIGTNPYIVTANVGISSGFINSNGVTTYTGQVKSISEQIESVQALPAGYFIDGHGVGLLTPSNFAET